MEVSRNDYDEKTDEGAGGDYNGYDDDSEECNFDEDFGDEGSNDVIDQKDGEFADGEVNSSDKRPLASEALRDEPKPAKDFCLKFEIVSYTFDISKSKKYWPLEKLKRRSLALLNRIELE